MKHRKFIQIAALLLGLMFTACNDYLDQIPDTSLSIDIDSEGKIAELLTGAYPTASYFPFLEPRTDNVGERLDGTYSRLNEAMYFWRDYDHEDLDTPLNYWNACYQGISQVNHALEHLKKHPKNERVKALYGEAFLLRAYLHFMLVNIWSEPYNDSTSDKDLGIPYVRTPEKNALINYPRGTVKEVYEHIEKDLLLGVSLINDQYYQKPKFHFNKEAAYAFAARFYLYKGEWQKVIEYANWVLGNDPSLRVRDWFAYYQNAIFGKPVGENYASVEEPTNLLVVTTESRFYRNYHREKYGMTPAVAKVLFGTGLTMSDRSWRWAYTFSGGESINLKKFGEYAKFESTGFNPRELYVDNILFAFDETLLNRAEALTMLRRYNEAISDVKIFLKKKISKSYTYEEYLNAYPKAESLYAPYYPLAPTQASIVQLIAELRRKEFAVEGLRWFDIRRFHLPVDRNQQGKPGNDEYLLKKGDKRRLMQIPLQAIRLGMPPNPR